MNLPTSLLMRDQLLSHVHLNDRVLILRMSLGPESFLPPTIDFLGKSPIPFSKARHRVYTRRLTSFVFMRHELATAHSFPPLRTLLLGPAYWPTAWAPARHWTFSRSFHRFPLQSVASSELGVPPSSSLHRIFGQLDPHSQAPTSCVVLPSVDFVSFSYELPNLSLSVDTEPVEVSMRRRCSTCVVHWRSLVLVVVVTAVRAYIRTWDNGTSSMCHYRWSSCLIAHTRGDWGKGGPMMTGQHTGPHLHWPST